MHDTCKVRASVFDDGKSPVVVVGIDARGFIFGSALAYALGVGFVPVRKEGKLPHKTVAQSYSLEYGDATVEVHQDAVKPGQRVLLVDDLVATGGTMIAAIKLLQLLGGNVVEAAAKSLTHRFRSRHSRAFSFDVAQL